jgi:hypothetical protein
MIDEDICVEAEVDSGFHADFYQRNANYITKNSNVRLLSRHDIVDQVNVPKV